MFLAKLSESAEFARGHADRFVFRHAGADVLFDRHRDVHFEFMVEISVQVGGSAVRAETPGQLLEKRST
jgi:hypothetical protein